MDCLPSVEILFSLKNNKRECNLLLFWLIFVLFGRKPLILKTFSGLKKNKVKFILRINQRLFISTLRVFSILILAAHEKFFLVLRQDQGSYFFVFKGTYLEYFDTFYLYSYIGTQDVKFLFENIYLIFKFKTARPSALNTALNSVQIPTTHDPKRNTFSNPGELGS